MNNILSRYRLRNTLVAVGLAVVGALLVFLYVANYRKDVQNGANLVNVYVAARDIPEGTDGASAVGNGYFEKESVFRRNVVDGAISSPNQIADLAAAQDILAGEQITVRQFHSVQQQGVLASISGNQRAMAIPGDANQLLVGVVNDGDRVDVLANIHYVLRPPAGSRFAQGGDLQRVASRVILRDLLVLRSPTSSGGGIGASGSGNSSILLAVSDSQAQKLLFAIKNGDWWLALRPVAKPSDSADSVETIESILGDGLGIRPIEQLTAGFGKESIGNGN
ncbi:MAG TPA: Flp pilus assembly protein CpaB [Gaiellaceae bacterium]|jgi:Flp pilus assembly protein CpaB